MTTINKSLRTRIEEINSLLPAVENSRDILYGYFGGTYPHEINFTSPIEIKNNKYVYMNCSTFENRYNVNNEWQLDELKYNLSQVLKEINKLLKDN
jgi:hypothetical protein